jgi:UDP-2,3-diacylglucosamine hydrolase
MNDVRPERLAIIAGSGRYPKLLAEALRARGTQIFIAGLSGSCNPADYTDMDCQIGGLGQIGRLVGEMKSRNMTDVVFLGALERPRLTDIKPDFGLVRFLPALRRAFIGGDDHLLRGVTRIFENLDFTVWGPLMLAPELSIPPGPLGRIAPSKAALVDIAAAQAVLDALGAHDIGQAVIAADGRVIAVEGIEGTSGLLVRAAELKAKGRLKHAKGSGVLVKIPKMGQDMRVDIPVIGADTVRDVAKAGLAGIAVAAGGVLVGLHDEIARAADDVGVFVTGLPWIAR